jgi:hypothetical protein
MLLILLTAAALAATTAVCLHSLQEIHYLKTFFPGTFSVEEAFYAGGLELFKVIVITIPLLSLIMVCLFFLHQRCDGSNKG